MKILLALLLSALALSAAQNPVIKEPQTNYMFALNLSGATTLTAGQALCTNWIEIPLIRTNGGTAVFRAWQSVSGHAVSPYVKLILFSRPPTRTATLGSTYDVTFEDSTYCLGTYPLTSDRYSPYTSARVGSIDGMRVLLENSTNDTKIYAVPVAGAPFVVTNLALRIFTYIN